MSEPTTETDDLLAAGPLGRFAGFVGDRLNPILVKETRQALKSKQFTLWFVLLLIACWIATLGSIAIIGPSIYYVSAGGYLLFVYYVILALPLIVVVPFSAYRSLASEHEENTRDLLEVSTLTPRQVVNGKLGSAVLQIAIYLSALAPCLAFTYLLRGVELIQIILLLVYAVLASLGLAAVGLVLAAATRQKYAQVVMSVGLAGGLFAAFSGLLSGVGALLQLDATELRSQWFWWLHLAMFSAYATTLGLAYAAAISLTTFTSANRSTGLRLAMFVQQAVYIAWVAGLLAAGLFSLRDLSLLFLIAASYWFVAGALMTGEKPTLSLRVRRSLPQSLLGRALGGWFNPGSGSGYVFATANLMTVAALTIASLAVFAAGQPGVATLMRLAGLVTAYVVAYLGIGRLAVLGLRRVAEVSLLGCFLIQILFVLGGSGLPFVVRTLSERVRITDLSLLSLPSPTWNFNRMVNGQIGPDEEVTLLILVGSVATILFLVNLALAGLEARLLRVAAPQRVLEDERERRPPPEPRATNPWGDVTEAAPESAG